MRGVVEETRKTKGVTRPTIAARLVARIRRETGGKVVDIANVMAGRAIADDLQKTVASREDLAGFHPAHAAYVLAQDQLSVMSEQITALDEMSPFVEVIAEAEDLYLPGGPPMSPLTTSYFTCWAFCDACVGPTNETIASVVEAIGGAFGMHPEILRLIRLLRESRMGLFVHAGVEDGLVALRDIVTGCVCRAVSPAGYLGRKDEIWYVRVLPPPVTGGLEHVVFTTPYVLIQPPLKDWQAYFRRTLPNPPAKAQLDLYERHMKYGPTRSYWNDFVFEAYVNYRTEVIWLAGLPDVPESRPHSRVNGWGFGDEH